MAGRRTFIKTAALAVPGLAVLGASKPQWVPSSSLPDEEYWDEIRQLYALPDSRTYLNTGGLGPSPTPVLDRYNTLTAELQGISETGHHFIEEARAPVSQFFGADETEISFTRNATEGNATIASGLRLSVGDEIIIDAHAHPGGAIPWLNLLKERGVVVKLFEPDAPTQDEVIQRIVDQMTPRTRVIQISHVTAPTGILLPAREIALLAREWGCWFHIDGAQSAGMLPINLHDIGCDSYATSGHKWLGAPHGTGILYISKDRLDDVFPTEVGAYSDASYTLPDQLEYIATSRRHESGTRNAPLVEGIRTACAFMGDIGMERVRERGLELTELLRLGLEEIESIEVLSPVRRELRGSILTFKSSRIDYASLNRTLGSIHKLRLRVVTERELNAIRVSLHVFNSPAEVARIVESVSEALKM